MQWEGGLVHEPNRFYKSHIITENHKLYVSPKLWPFLYMHALKHLRSEMMNLRGKFLSIVGSIQVV